MQYIANNTLVRGLHIAAAGWQSRVQLGGGRRGPLSYIQTVHCCKYIQWHRGVLQYILGLGGGSYTATQYSLANYAILKTAFSLIELGV